MLIEQAFFNLPEIMVGNGYVEKEYEGGIVSAFSLALLQELNGRNINNPISCIYAEERYDQDHNYRSDLYIDLTVTELNNDNLRQYGFRQRNYLEAKFFRGTQSNTTDNVLKILLDLYRIMIMPISKEESSDNKSKKNTNIGRYFLHVYFGEPEEFYGKKFNWLLNLSKPGIQEIKVNLSEENNAFANFPQNINACIKMNNLCIQSSGVGQKLYTFVLSRLDKFNLIDNSNKITYEVDCKGIISCNGDLQSLVSNFVKKTKPSSDKQKIQEYLLDKLPIKTIIDTEQIKKFRENLAQKKGKDKTTSDIIQDIISYIESRSEEYKITEIVTELIEKYDVKTVENELIEYLATEINNHTKPKDQPYYHSFKKALKNTLSKVLRNLFDK